VKNPGSFPLSVGKNIDAVCALAHRAFHGKFEARGTFVGSGGPGKPLTEGLSQMVCSSEHSVMEDQAKNLTRPRSLSDYWIVFCAVLLFVIVVYAVATAN
jgi:hypothetical protein